MSPLKNSKMPPCAFLRSFHGQKEGNDELQGTRHSSVYPEILQRRITQEHSAKRIGISVRQVKRLVYRYGGKCPTGLVSCRCGNRLSNAFTTAFRASAISLFKECYSDFGPALASEKDVKFTVWRYQ